MKEGWETRRKGEEFCVWLRNCLETIVILSVCVCACVSACLQLIPVQLALKQGFQSPCWVLAETHMADGGMDRRVKGERGMNGGREMEERHAVTH